jgi:site-specific DNA-methyltransferase (adenine-specific)
MNDIFNDNVTLKTETPAFAKHVLPAVPTSEVYLEDCVTALKRYADNHFDLAIVDPPYGIGFDNKIREAKTKNWDSAIPTDEYFNELKRVSKNQIIWGANYFPYLWQNGCKGFVFWNKDVNFDSYSAGELAYTSFDKPAKYFYYAWNGLADGIRGRNKQQKTIHPTQKPTALYEWLLMNFAKEGDLILDTHLGSGSSRIAAYKGGFNFVGFEIDQEYYEKQEKRFNDFKSQLRLF